MKPTSRFRICSSSCSLLRPQRSGYLGGDLGLGATTTTGGASSGGAVGTVSPIVTRGRTRAQTELRSPQKDSKGMPSKGITRGGGGEETWTASAAGSSKSLRSLAVTPKASRSALACLRQSGSSVAQRLNGMAIYGLLCFTPSLLRPSWSMAASFRAPAGTSLYTPPSLARPRRVRVPPSSSIRGRGRRHASADSHVAPPPRTPRRVTMTYDRTWGRVHRTRDQRADCTTRAPPLVACRGGIASLAAARVP
ncbi:hypothetical protein BHE74_00028533 [Ensete ventricosum]|nr:hypothetical protein BHE74_00028533 [Ensete ventricosum]